MHFRRSSVVLSVGMFLVGLGGTVAPAGDETLQTVGRVERLAPKCDELVPADASLEVIGQGYKWSEGPVWVPEGAFLLFSDIPNNAIMRWDEQSGSQIFLKPAGYTGTDPRDGESGSNGLTLDGGGRLILCQHGDRRVARLNSSWQSPRPSFETLADKYEGKRFNSPNDAIVDSKGAIYFTDPPYGLVKGMSDPGKELGFQGVYRIERDGGVTLLTREMERPNGIALSPDEKTLYVANSHDERPVIMAFPINDDGTLGKGREFYNATDVTGKEPGACDGLCVDVHGNVFATIPGGVGVFTPDGKQVGLLATGDRTSNCAFGGADGSTLFITANHNLLRIQTTTKGAEFRRQ